MRLTIVRHGQTEANKLKICQGQSESPLSSQGQHEATLLGLRLASQEFTAIYSSDLGRAVQTANLVLKARPLSSSTIPLYKDARIRERTCGIYEGKKLPPDLDWDNPPPEIESDASLQGRVREFIHDIYTKHQHDDLLIVTHAGAKMALLNVLYDAPVDAVSMWAGIKNTGVSIVEYNGISKSRMPLINCTRHLK